MFSSDSCWGLQVCMRFTMMFTMISGIVLSVATMMGCVAHRTNMQQ